MRQVSAVVYSPGETPAPPSAPSSPSALSALLGLSAAGVLPKEVMELDNAYKVDLRV